MLFSALLKRPDRSGAAKQLRGLCFGLAKTRSPSTTCSVHLQAGQALGINICATSAGSQQSAVAAASFCSGLCLARALNMGNTSSVPERVYKAARANDVNELQGLCRDMRLNGALDAATKRKWLNWTDAEGRTALHHACQRNYLQVAQILLDEGADVHLVAPKRAGGGSPLAEAVAGRHEALVELLLQYGADPFTESRGGKAPLDLALELKAVNILRSFERHALFAGYVNMKVLQLKGFSHAAKDRWVVVAPRFSPPSEGSGGVGIVRIMMLVYRNAAEADPRTKCWLDGASIFRAGQEAVLRLHSNHEQPRNAFTKYDNGWMLFFKQATTSYSTPTAAGPTVAPTQPALQQAQQQRMRRSWQCASGRSITCKHSSSSSSTSIMQA
ncbi:hypothetical protein COO60DRAFT_1624220 [Scenedesmus sp. NREL 46B-D3]|nr:hypothetical protein COO60DRAFT_1624220 [Scenedesmus sp. NREL 46B-D3]